MTVTINGTTGIAGTNGSAGTPAVQGEDTNTGVFFPAADTVAVATGGSERMRLDASGNLGVGTASPSLYTSYGLHINAPSSGNTGSEIKLTKAGQANSSFIQHLSGSMGLGTEAGFMSFSTGVGGSSERARIDASGNLLVGTTTDNLWTGSSTNTGFKAEQNGTITASRNGFAALLVKRTTGSTGNLVEFAYGASIVGTIGTNGTSTSYNTSSDYRLKENVQPMQDALAKVAQLNPVTYTWKADGSAGQGFIAHELQAVVPDCVTGEKDAVDEDGNPQYQGVDTSFLVATLTKAIQELKAELDAAKARIAALEGV